MFKIVACGLSCPEPLVLLQDAISKYNQIEMIGDGRLVKENVVAYVTKANCKCVVDTSGSVFKISISK